GQIGGVLSETLLRANRTTLSANPIRVYGVARRALPADGAPEGLTFLAGSVAEARPVESLPEGDYIVYVAGTASDYLQRRQETFETQVVGLERFLSRFRSCR